MQLYLSQLRSFTREARLFLLALVLFAFATSVPGLFFNLYLQSLGFSRAFIGITTTAAQVGGAMAALPAAALLDRIGRRRSALLGIGIAIAGAGAVLLTTNSTLIIVIEVMTGCGVVLYALAVVPLLAEMSTPLERTTLFSTTDGLIILASFFGSLIAGGLPALVAPTLAVGPESPAAYRAVMLGSLFVRALGILPLALIHDNARSHDPMHVSPARRSTLRYFDPRVLLRLETPIWVYSLPVLITYLGASLIMPFLNLFLKQRFGISDIGLGTIIGAMNLLVGICALLGPFAAQALGRTRAVVLGAFVSAICFFLIGFGSSLGLVAGLIILRAGIFNMTLPLYRAYVIDHTPAHEYVVVNLIYSTAANVGPTIAPPVSGYIQDHIGFNPLFLMVVGLYGLAGLFFFLATRKDRETTQSYAKPGLPGDVKSS